MGEYALFLWAQDPKWEWFSTKKCEKKLDFFSKSCLGKL